VCIFAFCGKWIYISTPFLFFPVNLWKIYKAVETLGGYDAVGVLKQTKLSQPVAGLSPPISHSCHW